MYLDVKGQVKLTGKQQFLKEKGLRLRNRKRRGGRRGVV